MRIKIGAVFDYVVPQPTPIIALLSVHHERFGDLERPDHITTSPTLPISRHRDGFRNWCSRFTAPEGSFSISVGTIIRDSGGRDPSAFEAGEHAVENIPSEELTFLLRSRYCETDRLSEEASRLFSGSPRGWARVQTICDFVYRHVAFGYEHSRPTRTAAETYAEGRGVCRDCAYLAIAFCRCMNIPARYCTGYLGDIGEPPTYPPEDFATSMEVWLGGRWHGFDPRNNSPRIGCILIARGGDAADVPLAHTFGPNRLAGFRVWTDEIA